MRLQQPNMAQIDDLVDALASVKIDVVNGKVLNPKTNRWVKATGKIGRELILVSAAPKLDTSNEPWDIEQWRKHGGYELAPGESVKVKGSLDPEGIHTIYTVKRSEKVPNSVYCSCPAWKYQKLHPLVRTCKHCKAVCGDSTEMRRIENNK